MVRSLHLILFALLSIGILAAPSGAYAERGRRHAVIDEQRGQEMELLLRIHTALLKLEMQLDQQEDGQVNRSTLAAQLRDTTKEVLSAYHEPEQKALVEKIMPQVLAKVAWDKAADHVIEAAHMVRKTNRVNGLLPAALLTVGLVADFALPPILFGMQAPAVVQLASGFTPWVFALPGAYLGLRAVRDHARMRAAYDPQRLEEVTKASEAAKEALRLQGATDVLAPLSADEGFRRTIAVADRGKFRRFLEWIGWDERSATYERLSALMREYRPHDHFLTMLDRDRQTSKIVKAAMLASYLDQDPNDRLRNEFHRRFGHRIQTMPVRADLTELEGWALEATHAETFTELGEWLQRVPRGANARWVARLWRDLIIPRLFDGPLGRRDAARLREMRADASQIIVETDHATDPVWNPAWSNRFAEKVHYRPPQSWCARNFGSLARRVRNGELIF